jgi:hypothetical protein
MKEDFKNYLLSVGITTKIETERIEEIYQFYQGIGMEDEITGVFLTDYIQSDGTRIFENLWFFSKNFAMEAKQFLGNDDFDITSLHKRVDYWDIQKRDYDFKKATDKSRLNMSFGIDTGRGGSLKASKENCDYLRDIFLKYVMSNLKK